MRLPLLLLGFACVVVLCPATGCRDDSSQPKKEQGINIFDRRSGGSDRRIERPVNTVTARQAIEGIQQAGDPEKREASRNYFYFVVIFTGVAVVIGGLFYWQRIRQKRLEWQLNDPMALVEELHFVHQLSEQEKRVMREISERNALSSPLELFVEPKFLLEAWESDSYITQHPSVRQLLSKLFDITTDGGETTILVGMRE